MMLMCMLLQLLQFTILIILCFLRSYYFFNNHFICCMIILSITLPQNDWLWFNYLNVNVKIESLQPIKWDQIGLNWRLIVIQYFLQLLWFLNSHTFIYTYGNQVMLKLNTVNSTFEGKYVCKIRNTFQKIGQTPNRYMFENIILKNQPLLYYYVPNLI